jgi:hypothetical protein
MLARGWFYLSAFGLWLVTIGFVNGLLQMNLLAQQLLVFLLLFSHLLYPRVVLRKRRLAALGWSTLGIVMIVLALIGLGQLVQFAGANAALWGLHLKYLIGWPSLLVLSLGFWELAWQITQTPEKPHQPDG